MTIVERLKRILTRQLVTATGARGRLASAHKEGRGFGGGGAAAGEEEEKWQRRPGASADVIDR